MNINDIMLQGDAGSGTTEASSKYYNVGKNNAATADAGYLGIRSKAVQTDFMMPQLQGLRESGSENYTGRQATEIAADRVQNDNAASRNLKVVTGEDCAALEDEDSALEEYQKSSLERAVKRIREEREWKADRMEENKELREQLANDLEKMQQQGFLVSLIALASNMALAAYQLYRIRKLKLNPLKDQIYAGTKAYQRIVEENE